MSRSPMGIMFLVILFSVLYANAEGANGIVKNVLEEGRDLPKVTEYKHLLECDYRHDFPNFPGWTFTYDIHCFATTDKSGKTTLTLSINYDNIPFDNYEVTTCDRDEVIKSVFPPKQQLKYPSEFNLDSLRIPTVSYLKYKHVDGKCFARRYEYRNRVDNVAERFPLEKFNCENESEWSKHGKVAAFHNCRVPPEVLSKAVITYSQDKPAWTPDDDNEGQKHQRLLECTFDQHSQLYDLTCVKDESANEYFAFVTYQSKFLDRFTVISCKEEVIVNGIFPMKETTANPKNEDWTETIFFSMQDGNCYKRQYPKYYAKENTRPYEAIVPEPCPDDPEIWTNPTSGKVGMWRECKVPKVQQERESSEETSEESSEETT